MKTISKKRKKKLLNVQVTLLLLQLSSDDAVCIIILEFFDIDYLWKRWNNLRLGTMPSVTPFLPSGQSLNVSPI